MKPSPLNVSLDRKIVNYVACSAHENGGLIPELSALFVKGQRPGGKTASDTVFSQKFAKNALLPVIAKKEQKTSALLR